MARGNNRNVTFKNHSDYKYYLHLVARYKELHPFELFHYCLMPNHTHMLVQTRQADDFSVFMKKLNLAYFHYYKRLYGWVGHLWQGRYKSQPVGKDAYFIQCGKYIELNPVRKGIVKYPEHYKYSSYSFYADGIPNKLITEDIMFDELGKTVNDRQKEYQKLIVSQMIEDSFHKKAWGSEKQRYFELRKISRKFKKG